MLITHALHGNSQIKRTFTIVIIYSEGFEYLACICGNKSYGCAIGRGHVAVMLVGGVPLVHNNVRSHKVFIKFGELQLYRRVNKGNIVLLICFLIFLPGLWLGKGSIDAVILNGAELDINRQFAILLWKGIAAEMGGDGAGEYAAIVLEVLAGNLQYMIVRA